MAKNIEPKLRKIGDYLKLEDETFFMIPEYQRAYSWNIDQCDKLWQDIVDYVESERKDGHFFGTIIINCQDHDTILGLIDGQQRTTTFLLLLKALLININDAIAKTSRDDESESLCRGLKERRRKIMGILYKAETEDISDKPDREADRRICKSSFILKNSSINERYKTELQTILQAFDYEEAENNVEKIARKKNDNKYTNFFRNFKYFYNNMADTHNLSASQLNSISKAILESCEVIEIKSWQVEQAITMFNSLNSDGLPLYDSDIISAKLYAAAEGMKQGNEFKELWEELLKLIEELKEKGVTDLDAILMQKMYYVRAVMKETLTNKGSVTVTVPGLRRYFIDINKDLINHPIELCKDMINLAKIWRRVSEYPVCQILFKFNENAKLFLASYFGRFKEEDISEDKTETIFESILRLFTVMELVDTGYSSKNFKTFLFKEEVKLVDQTVSEQEIKEDFDNHIRDMWDRESIKNEILDYDKNSLVYLNEYLFAKEKGRKFIFIDKPDIEHIMPSSGKNNQEIRKDAGINSLEEFKGIVNKIGNKILLEERINRALGNEWFRTKVSTSLKEKTGYIDSVYPIACELVSIYGNKSKAYWKKEDIRKATEEAGDRIVRFIFGD